MKLRHFFWLLILALPLGTALPLHAETVDSVPNPLRTKRSWVSDNANVIDEASERQTNIAIENFKKQTGGEIAVVTVNDTEDETPKEFATELFNRWGVGEKGKDNGVLILLVMSKRRLEIETGYGAEADLPDGKVGQIRDDIAIPRFKSGDFGGGVLAAVQAIIQAMGGKVATAPPVTVNKNPPRNNGRAPRPAPTSRQPNSNPPVYNQPNAQPVYNTRPAGPYDWIFGLMILAAIPIGFGALIWGAVVLIRNLATRKCSMCGREMRRLGEDEEDAFLSSDQQFEERLGGLDYKVWRCETCGVSHVERGVRWFSGYEDCPRCKHHTLNVVSETVQEPTYYSTGLRVTTRACQYPNCGHTARSQQTIPRRERQSSVIVVGGGHHSSSDSSWGSSSSSSSSSDSGFSSSSSDFGGGSSGGGGAGGDW